MPTASTNIGTMAAVINNSFIRHSSVQWRRKSGQLHGCVDVPRSAAESPWGNSVQCGEFEVPISWRLARLGTSYSKAALESIDTASVPSIPSSHENVPRTDANVGIGTQLHPGVCVITVLHTISQAARPF
jgi:hypothetical protein